VISPALNGEVHTDSVREQAAALDSRITSSAAASTSKPDTATPKKHVRNIKTSPSAALAEGSYAAHTAKIQPEPVPASEGAPVEGLVGDSVGDPVGGPEGDPQMDPMLQGFVDDIMARRCPNLNRFQYGSAYDVKVRGS
jgi:hypothetical protein